LNYLKNKDLHDSLFGLSLALVLERDPKGLCKGEMSMRKKARFGFMVLLTALFAMNRHRFISGLFGLTFVLATVFMAACGGGATSTPPANATTFALTIHDNPPAGVTVLSFEIEITGATLQPSNGSAVSLLTSPVEIELEKLQTNSAFLSTRGVDPGTYDSLTLTFANPEMTILNQSGQPIVIGTQVCASGQICELKPQLNMSSAKLSGTPFPLTVGADVPIGLALDFDVNSSVQNNLSITPTLTATQATVAADGELEEEQDLKGQITAVGSGQFTLQDDTSGRSFTINVTSNTEFKDFSEIGCTTNDFSCVKSGQIVQVDFALMGTGILQAKEVKLEENVNEQELEGTVVSINAPGNQFQVVVVDEEPVANSAPVGSVVTVNIQAGASFQVENDGLNIPSGLSFASVNDLLVGQDIDIRALSVSSGVGGSSANTDRVRLRASQISGKVSAVSAPNFDMSNLNSLFTGAGITQIQVQTSSATGFEGVASVSGLNVNDAVSAEGLLFRTAGDPALIAKEVRKR